MNEEEHESFARFFCPCLTVVGRFYRTLMQYQPMPLNTDEEEERDVFQARSTIVEESAHSYCPTANSSVLQMSERTLSTRLPADECVICLGEFNGENPVMHTLCACGENRTKFHYPCLLIWLDKRDTCPSCNSYLFFEVNITICQNIKPTPDILLPNELIHVFFNTIGKRGCLY